MKHPKVMQGDQDIKTEEPRVNRGQVVRMVQGKDADNDDVYSEDLVQSVENEAGVISDQIVMSNGLTAEPNSDKSLHDGRGNSDRNVSTT